MKYSYNYEIILKKHIINVIGQGYSICTTSYGKTYFIEKQDKNNKVWIDADIILGHFKIHNLEYHHENHSEEEHRIHYLLCDKWLMHMKYLGMYILGSLFYEYVPDAIVIIDPNDT